LAEFGGGDVRVRLRPGERTKSFMDVKEFHINYRRAVPGF
jgi:hypothetical protein